ncbi:hypothetical protein E3N88_36352 [Mikania micrantha]|uniref:Uncharacterized protein n=1 Tax=Mikania micrantha TaxID=192012 RepID=A0A5N6M3W3_9ASTR|nr:hypothetical protein E3N88_36352 [Mikania micrantha]
MLEGASLVCTLTISVVVLNPISLIELGHKARQDCGHLLSNDSSQFLHDGVIEVVVLLALLVLVLSVLVVLALVVLVFVVLALALVVLVFVVFVLLTLLVLLVSLPLLLAFVLLTTLRRGGMILQEFKMKRIRNNSRSSKNKILIVQMRVQAKSIKIAFPKEHF